MNLEKINPDKYHRVLEITTREKRENEQDGVDYLYLSNDEFEKIEGDLIEEVKYQFAPYKYGAREEEFDESKWNVVVVSIEGFLTSMKSLTAADTAILFNIIIDTDLDIERSGRSPLVEENYNLGVINAFLDEKRRQVEINGNSCFYYELPLSKLKEIRNIPAKCLDFFETTISNLIKETLKSKLKHAETYEDLISIFMNNSTAISSSTTLLDILEIQTKKFGRSVEDLCNDSLKILRGYS